MLKKNFAKSYLNTIYIPNVLVPQRHECNPKCQECEPGNTNTFNMQRNFITLRTSQTFEVIVLMNSKHLKVENSI